MTKQFVAIWFCHLATDAVVRRQPGLRSVPFVLASPDHGRLVITAANSIAQAEGVYNGMAVADARAIIPSLAVFDDVPDRAGKLLKALAEWCIRYTPVAAVDLPGGIILDSTGCAHLWGGEHQYLDHIQVRFAAFGYEVRIAMASAIGTAWAISRFGISGSVIPSGDESTALLSMPIAALRLEPEIVELMQKLGLRQVKDFIAMPRTALRRRFGKSLLLRLDQALGQEEEVMTSVQPIELYQERLPCLEPIVTATGIEIALTRLLDLLCRRLQHEGKGLRQALFKSYRVDGKIEVVSIGTHRPSNNMKHLLKLFEFKLCTIEPALGIELFILDALQVEEASPLQESLWEANTGLQNAALCQLIDRLTARIGEACIHRYLPDEHHWPERSIKATADLAEQLVSPWQTDKDRPVQLLQQPALIEVTAPIPDYPPMLFRYKGELHTIKKADGPERIEQEWWLAEGQHRDYYKVEDETGKRYWLFRSGHYDANKSYQWFIHGFFA